MKRFKRELTKPNGSYSDWGPSMFKTVKIERLY